MTEEELLQQLTQLSLQQKAIGEQLNASNRNMRGLIQRVWNMQEREQKALAHELHDGVGQLLTALVNQLELLVSKDDQEFNQNLLQLARQSLADIRLISRLMHPQILDDLGLEAALNWLVRQMSNQQQLAIQLEYAEDFTPDPSVHLLFFRVCQESLSNIVKHAQASKVNIQLSSVDNSWQLKITDNGVGFERQQAKSQGFGLSAMQDRVTSFGGILDITTEPGKGCSITVTLDKSAVAQERL